MTLRAKRPSPGRVCRRGPFGSRPVGTWQRWHGLFLRELYRTRCVSKAAKEAKTSRPTAYRHKSACQPFQQIWLAMERYYKEQRLEDPDLTWSEWWPEYVPEQLHNHFRQLEAAEYPKGMGR